MSPTGFKIQEYKDNPNRSLLRHLRIDMTVWLFSGFFLIGKSYF